MRRNTRSSAQKQHPLSDKPMAPTHVDLEIGRHHGTTVALDATHDRLQASKKAQTPTLSDRVHELTKENGQLRLEIRCYQQMQEAAENLYEDVKFADKELERAIVKFDRVWKEIMEDYDQATKGDREV